MKKLMVCLVGLAVFFAVIKVAAYNVWAGPGVEIVTPEDEPVITGAQNFTLFLGQQVNYSQNISAVSYSGATIEVQVDASGIDINTPGQYPLVYMATDEAGQTTTARVQVKVLAKTEDDVYSMVDGILTEILTPGAGARQIAQRIHKYVSGQIRYVPTAAKICVSGSAYAGLTYGKGDCYTYYALAELMLTRAGIETVGVTRSGGQTSHYWNLVKIEEEWYHFDACPTPSSTGFSTCLFTNSQAQAYTAQMGESWNYYSFDESQYPQVN